MHRFKNSLYKEDKSFKTLLSLVLLGVATISFPYIFGFIKLPRIEEFSYSLLPLELSEQMKKTGVSTNFFGDYGLGVPWPIPHTMSKSPFVSLFGFGNPFQSMGQFMAIHISIQIIALWFIGREFRFKNSINIFFVLSVTFSSQLEYLVTSDAAAVYLGWVLLPTIFLGIFKITNSKSNSYTLLWVLFLGFFISYSISNTHPGVFSTYLLSSGLLFLSLNFHSLKKILFGMLSLLLSLLLSAEKIYTYLSQWLLYPEWVQRNQYNYDSSFSHTVWSLFAKPFTFSSLSNGNIFDFKNWILENQYTRVLFFGSPVATFLLLYIIFYSLKNLRFTNSLGMAGSKSEINISRILILNFLFVCSIQLIPAKYLSNAVSASWTFRDPGTIFGLLIIAVYLNKRVNRSSQEISKYLLLVTHFVSISLSSFFIILGPTLLNDPFFWTAKQYDNLISNVKKSEPIMSLKLIDKALACETTDCDRFGRRVALSGLVSNLLARGELKESGLVLNSFPFLGFQEVNSVTKGISQDLIHTSQSKFYGMITDDTYQSFSYVPENYNWLLQNPALRDFVGIRVILASSLEKINTDGLELIGQFESYGSQHVINVFRNTAAFPNVIHLAKEPTILPTSKCNENQASLTCIQFKKGFEILYPHPKLTLSNSPQNMVLHYKRLPFRSLVLTNIAWSRAWISDDGTIHNFHGLVGVKVPANTNRIELSFEDNSLDTSRKIEGGTYVLFFVILFLLTLKGSLSRRRFETPGIEK